MTAALSPRSIQPRRYHLVPLLVTFALTPLLVHFRLDILAVRIHTTCSLAIVLLVMLLQHLFANRMLLGDQHKPVGDQHEDKHFCI